MNIHLLDHRLWFPDPRRSAKRGIVAVGGDLSVSRLKLAYYQGLFPWFSEDEPILWWCPDPRFVLFPQRFRLRKSLRQSLRRQRYEIYLDRDFERVIRQCATLPRDGQQGTWITEEMIRAYLALHRAGLAHSIEAYRAGMLCGGLYGVGMGPFFFGESMFHTEPDASKMALAALVALYGKGQFIDCQIHSSFFESMGADHLPRGSFLNALEQHRDEPDLWPVDHLSLSGPQILDRLLHS